MSHDTAWPLTSKVSRAFIGADVQPSHPQQAVPMALKGKLKKQPFQPRFPHEFEMQPYLCLYRLYLKKKKAWVHPKCLRMTGPADVHAG